MSKARILADYVAGGTTAAEFDYMDGVTSNVQTQMDAKAPLASPTFTGVPVTPALKLTPTDTPPASVTGSMYYDDSEKALKHYDGTSWEPVVTSAEYMTAHAAGYDSNGTDGEWYWFVWTTSGGTFVVDSGGNKLGSNTIQYLVIGGGGGGGKDSAGGGGAGGYRNSCTKSSSSEKSGGDSSLEPAFALPVGSHTITVGAAGVGKTGARGEGTKGGDSSIGSHIVSDGGGGGSGGSDSSNKAGGSGGGHGTGGVASTSPYTQGFAGGSSGSAGGGGAGTIGGAGSFSWPSSGTAGAGGNGLASSINNSTTTRAGGGGGAGDTRGVAAGAGGSGGGGAGKATNGGSATAGTTNTGSGGGGGAYSTGTMPEGGNGGSGIVIIRYKFKFN